MKLYSMVRRFLWDLSLATKIASFSSLLILLIVPVMTLLTIERERDTFQRELESQASLLLDTLPAIMRNSLRPPALDNLQEAAKEIGEHHNNQITLFKVWGADGGLLVDADAEDPEAIFPNQVDPASKKFLELPPDQTYFDTDWEDDELIAGRSVWIGDDPVGAVEIGFSTKPLDGKIRDLTEQSIALAAALLTIGMMLSAFVAHQIARPIRALTRTAIGMAGGDLKTHFQPQSRDEIGQLGHAFNEMASAIEKRETELRELARGLEQTVQERTLKLQQQNQYLGALHEVTLGLIENLDVDRLLEAIMTRAASLVDTEHAFVNIVDPERGEMQRRVAKGGYRAGLGTWTKPNQGLSGRVMMSGQMMIEEDYQLFDGRDPEYDWLRTSIYVPLRSESTILGVIGLGYDKVAPVHPDHVDILNQFAQLASLALKNAQLYSAAQRELSETEQALLAEEERHQVYLASPQGRAETLAESMLKDRANALITLHELTQKAEQNGNAEILSKLPSELERRGEAGLAKVAEGYHFIHRGQTERELLTVGLRHIQTGLDMPETKTLKMAAEVVTLYNLCRQALDAEGVRAITELLPVLQAFLANDHLMMSGLTRVLRDLIHVAEALYAYERVDTTQDRQAYLTTAVERLSHVDQLARVQGPADRPIAQRIVENWLGIVTGSISDLRTRAQIVCRLLTRNTWDEEPVTVALELRNEGHAAALNLRVSLAESHDYIALDEVMEVERLVPGEEAQVTLQVQPRQSPGSNQFRARFTIQYEDPRGPGQIERFADVIHLMASEQPYHFIPNPYVVGTPLQAGSPLFFGRDDLFNFIGENLNAAHRNNLVLIGQRRTGKSSLLKQLPLRLGEGYAPVYLDGQSIVLEHGLPSFFSNLATEIAFALQARGFDIEVPDPNEFASDPGHTFERGFLHLVRAVIGERHLVLLLDEFEELESAVKHENLDASIFGFLRHLIQHESGLSVIFCGTHRLEELAADYWSVLFNISLYKHVGFLEYSEALRLIQEPVASYGMRYDDLALDKMWRVTAGHPYFLQFLCHSVVNQHNRLERNYVTISDINTALDEIFSAGEAHFVYLWNESSREERQVLAALSRMMPLTGRVTPVQVTDYLVQRGVLLDRQIISEALHRLALRDILAMQIDGSLTGAAGTYGWQLGLLGLWVEKYKSLSGVQEEIRT